MKDLLIFTLRHHVGILILMSVFTLDQAAKHAVLRMLGIGESWVIYGTLRLTHATNFGSAMNLFSGHTTALIIASTAGICVLFALYWHRPKTGLRPQITFGLMLAGAAGNLIDRIAFGHVIDFIDILPWFIFNVADMAILIGLAGFIWDMPDLSSRLLAKPIQPGQ